MGDPVELRQGHYRVPVRAMTAGVASVGYSERFRSRFKVG